MPQATSRWTAEMVRALPDDGNRYEVIDGELFVTPAPAPRHQRAVAKIQFPLTSYTLSTRIGETLASPADISTREDRLVQPDLFVLPKGHRPIRKWTEITHLLLAVEVLSPSTARADRQEKRRLYAELADEYWIVDLDARLIERWRPDDQRPEILTERLNWQPASGNPAFELELPPFFDEVGAE
ncbi:MAG: Uma2 family endonuclease [Gemmatimonadetes bacterium]|nr:Uma2 family endonuclease [Gemmatimonadota bacterium]